MRIALSAKRLSGYIRVQKGISYTIKILYFTLLLPVIQGRSQGTDKELLIFFRKASPIVPGDVFLARTIP